jgi:hypothetical protein
LSKRKKNPSYQPLKDRSAFDGHVIGWLKTAHRNGPLSGVRMTYVSYLSNSALTSSVLHLQNQLAHLTTFLGKTDEWGKE